ncbi:cyclin-F-like [Leptonychotes weddellii]|uniref:Cyclin-F-like n=1 Tax=Leptonychotes weddellii TaxID=9713 RepID=A0A7F8RCF2_LEPWE|nr:cyclin-F-like [Leptonychotes weddellii]
MPSGAAGAGGLGVNAPRGARHLSRAAMIHCRCAKCFCYPTKRRIRRRPRNLTILSLPEDVLFHILKWLSVGDILAVRAVHSHLKYLVDNHASVWACASFQELWPSPRNLKLFERAAEKGNFEAAVKLGIAYLYNEGLSVSDEARAEVNGLKASRFFSLAERLNVGATPFIWLFIRPPWSVSGSCCKAVVHESLRAECQLQGAGPGEGHTWGRHAGRSEPHRTHRASILHCLGRVLSLFEVSRLSRPDPVLAGVALAPLSQQTLPYAEKSFAKLMIKEPALQQTQGRWRLLVTGAAAGRDTAHVSEAREEP